jgi:hypothetical protein
MHHLPAILALQHSAQQRNKAGVGRAGRGIVILACSSVVTMKVTVP